MEALIKVHPNWLKEEQELMRRVAAAIVGPLAGWEPTRKPGSQTAWQLDPGNNYWAEIREGQLCLTSRYGGKKFLVLTVFLAEWLD